MQIFSRWSLSAFFMAVFLGFPFSSALAAAEAANASVPQTASASGPVTMAFSAEPMASYTFVNGDSSKFRAIHWAPEGYVAGVREFSAKGQLQDDLEFEARGSAVPEEAEYSGLVSLTKEDLGYVKLNFDQFRKYYQNGGGFYSLAPQNLHTFYTDKDLALIIGKFGVEAGITMKYLPDVVLNYERSYKEGTKSRLNWGAVYNISPDPATDRRYITPSWQQIDEITDSFDVKLSDSFYGYNWKAEQHWEYMHANNDRNTFIANSATARTNQISDFYSELRSAQIATVLGLNRWYIKEKVYVSGGYRFSQVNSRELYSLVNSYYPTGVAPVPGSTDYLPSPSDNLNTAQTGVVSFMTTLFNPLTIITRFKTEAIHRNGESTWAQDSSTNPAVPDGIVNTYVVSNNQEKIANYGESVSFRYTGIPRLALYNDYEFEQTRNNISNFRESSSNGTSNNSSDRFTQQRLDHQYRGSGTLGMNYTPWNQVTMTLQGRYKEEDTHFNNVYYSRAAGLVPGLIATVWLDRQKIRTDEGTARITWKPVRWFEPSFRYQLVDKAYRTSGEPDSDTTVDTSQISSVYTYDLVSQPVDDLLLTASFSYQDGKVITPNRYVKIDPDGETFSLPTFDFDSYTTLFSAEWALNQNLVLTGVADYTRAANFNDFSSTGMPYGADFYQTDLTMGLRWEVKKDFTVEPKYAFYQYHANQAEVGSYNAHMISLEVRANWG